MIPAEPDRTKAAMTKTPAPLPAALGDTCPAGTAISPAARPARRAL